MTLSVGQLQLIEGRVANDGPSTGATYLLWFFLGIVSAHRFYLGRPASAILQILSYFVLVGFIWWLIDAFLIPGMIRSKKDDLRHRYMTAMIATGEGDSRQAEGR